MNLATKKNVAPAGDIPDASSTPVNTTTPPSLAVIEGRHRPGRP